MNTNNDMLIIDNEAALVDICSKLKDSVWLAIDTEFERVKTYYPELCLLQISNGTINVVIDPLVIDNIKPVIDLIYEPSVIKVFHAARQDLELFFNINGSVPTPLFDTQIAAPLLGYDEQTGYANLVKRMLGVELSKAYTRTDWKHRPLGDKQLRYAADDVIYLGQVYQQCFDRLSGLGRLEWLQDDFNDLAKSKHYFPDPDKVWKKIKDAKRFKGKKLSVLQHLAAWREQTARDENKPRKWLIGDHVIVDIAQQLPANESELSRIKSLHERVLKRYSSQLLDLIDKAQHKDPQSLAPFKKRLPLTVQQEAIVDVLMSVVRLKAEENNLNPATLASRKELEKFVQDQNGSVLLKGWREKMIGNDLSNILSGKLSINIDKQELSVVIQT